MGHMILSVIISFAFSAVMMVFVCLAGLGVSFCRAEGFYVLKQGVDFVLQPRDF